MTTNTQKAFFEAWEIGHCVRKWQQYNHAQVPRGLEVYKESLKLEEKGIIKISATRRLEPSDFNDCVYWEEWHYPTLTPERVLALFDLAGKVVRSEFYINFPKGSDNSYSIGCIKQGERRWEGDKNIHASEETFELTLLSLLTQLEPELSEEAQNQVREVFK